MLRSLRGGSRVVAFVLLAVFAQIFRNWLLLHAVGVDASFFDAIAVLIAVVTLGQLPVGPSVGAASAVLILGSNGVAAAAAAGVLMTVTGTIGGLCFAAWAGADHLWSTSAARPGAPSVAGEQPELAIDRGVLEGEQPAWPVVEVVALHAHAGPLDHELVDRARAARGAEGLRGGVAAHDG